MRKSTSLFNRVCYAVNLTHEQRANKTYKTKDLLEFCKGYENNTYWKRDPFYRTRSYQSMLRRAGILKNVKRGEWQVLMSVPEWFSLGHLQHMIGQPRYNPKTHSPEKFYKGLTADEIRTALVDSQQGKMTADLVAKKVEWVGSVAKRVAESSYFENTAREAAKEVAALVEKIGKSENYSKPVNKTDIAVGTGEDLDCKITRAAQDLSEALNLTENLGRLSAAANLLRECNIKDQFMRARVYNALVLVQDIANALEEKRNFILND